MKDMITGILLMFVVSSCVEFWYDFIYLEKTKQIDLKKESRCKNVYKHKK